MKWKVISEAIPQDSKELKQILLENREIGDSAAFFTPLHPSSLTLINVGINPAQLKKTVDRIHTAIENKEKIIIYGDYDADGICATAILWKTLHSLGADAIPFIPEREKHGYGISKRSIPDLQELKPELIITVDNGIVAHEAIKELAELGYPVIITDHHQPETDDAGNDDYPAAFAVVHTTQLCGSTVAWMLSKELNNQVTDDLLDLCAISSIADQVRLQNANRSFVYHGLEKLKQTQRVGILELCTSAGIEPKSITASTVGYQLAPRINAMGRIAHGMDALRLLCTESKKQAHELAQVLQQTNTDRQVLTNDMFEEALVQVEAQKDEHILYVYSEHFHEGVIGLIAGKLTEKFYKPAIAMSVSGGFAKASARSVKGVSIIEMLRAVRSDLLEVGGHMLAGGFSLETDRIEVVKQRLQTLAKEIVTREMLEPFVITDCELLLSLVTVELAQELKQFEPCGQGNPYPTFVIKNAKVNSISIIGKDGQHRKLMLCLSNSDSYLKHMQQLPALWWNVPHGLSIQEGDVISAVVTLDLNHYKGRTSVQMMVKDVQSS